MRGTSVPVPMAPSYGARIRAVAGLCVQTNGTMKSMKGMKNGVQGIHDAQLLTCMKLSGIKQGFLINFNVRRLKRGLKRFVLCPFMLFMSFMVRKTCGCASVAAQRCH